MQSEVVEPRRVYGRVYAEPLAGLRVSWGAILAGAATTAAVAVLLWAIAFAIVMTVTHVSFGSLHGATMALWICAIAATLVGAFFGGAIAGYMPGNANRRIALGHGFLGWCLAFLVTTAVGSTMMAGIGTAVTETAATTAAGVIQGTGAAVGGAVGATSPQAGQMGPTGPAGLTPVEQREMGVLVTAGYTPEQARQMMMEQRSAATRITQGGARHENPGMAAEGALKSASDSLLGMLEAVGWTWSGTWTAALIAALAGAALGGQALRRRAGVEPAPIEGPVGGETLIRTPPLAVERQVST